MRRRSLDLRSGSRKATTSSSTTPLSRVGKGAAAILQVTGPKDDRVYRDHGDGAHEGLMAH